MELLTKKGTIRKRAPKKKNIYFTKENEEAILEYVASSDPEFRNNIYNAKIKNAFFKLTENIIHTYKFYYTEVDSIEDLQQEVIAFLLEKLHLYQQSKGKAYSYFGTIAKRYLINSNDTNYRKRINKINIANINNDENIDERFVADNHSYKDKEVAIEFMDEYIKHLSENLDVYFPNNKKNKKSKIKDVQIADAVLSIFSKRHSVNIFNKKALYHNIKEMIFINTNEEATTPHITSVSNQMSLLYKQLYEKYQNGEPPFKNVKENIFIS